MQPQLNQPKKHMSAHVDLTTVESTKPVDKPVDSTAFQWLKYFRRREGAPLMVSGVIAVALSSELRCT